MNKHLLWLSINDKKTVDMLAQVSWQSIWLTITCSKSGAIYRNNK